MHNRHLKPIQNEHKGKRCFIVGSAPSLSELDLSKLKNEITFGSNQIYRFYDKGLPTVSYYHIGDESCVAKVKADYENGFKNQSAGMKFYRAGGCHNYIHHFDDAIPYYLDGDDENKGERFTYDITDFISHGWSITTESIAFAMFMGCKPIIIIGVTLDYGHKPMIEYDRVYRAHKIIKSYADSNGVEIYNAHSRKGEKFDIYEHENYEDLF